jgi:hypothetical protein
METFGDWKMALAAVNSVSYGQNEQWPGCGDCDREVVRGVACDGRGENCPARLLMSKHLHSGPTHTQVYIGEVSELAVAGEFDAVRSET